METRHFIDNLQAVIEAINEGIFITDVNGICIYCNNTFYAVTGLQENVVGKHVSWLVKKSLISDAVTLETLRNKRHVSKMITYPSGCEALVTGNPVFDNGGELIAVICILKDLTELNALREELEASKKIAQRYRKSLQFLRAEKEAGLILKDPNMKRLVRLVEHVALSEATILITGESGVGKGLIANLIHNISIRSSESELIKIDCGAIPENLLESELFGYEPGAFTGARSSGKIGLIELANGGTLFLDEIAEMPLSLQVKLLNVLQDRSILRVGGIEKIKIDVRIIAATNRNLENMVAEGLFRDDLFYRLNVVPVNVPPLRERKEDITALVAFFLKKYNQKYNKQVNLLPEVIDRFLEYSWPGNVRELENTIERLVVLETGEHSLGIYALPPKLKANLAGKNFLTGTQNGVKPLRKTLEQVEKEIIRQALTSYPTLKETSQALKIDISTLVRKCKKLGINTHPAARGQNMGETVAPPKQ